MKIMNWMMQNKLMVILVITQLINIEVFGQATMIEGSTIAVTDVEDTWTYDDGVLLTGGVTWQVTGGTVNSTVSAYKFGPNTLYSADITFTSTGTQTITLIRNSTGATIYTKNVDVISPLLQPGTIGSSATLCPGETPAAFTSNSDASGGTGSYAYQWQHRNVKIGGEFEDIPGNSVGKTLQYGSVYGDTEIIRKVTSGGVVKFSNVILLNVLTLNAGSISGTQTVCYNGNPGVISNALSATIEGGGSVSYQWQISSNGSDWSDISSNTFSDDGGVTSASYDPGKLTSNKWFRRKVTACTNNHVKYTTSVKITVRGNPSSYTINSNKSELCAGEFSATISLSQKQTWVEYRLIKGSSQVGNTIQGSASSISWSGQGIGTYKIQGRSNSSCPWVDVSGSKEVKTKNPGSLSIAYSGGSKFGCPGTSVTLVPSGGSGYSWTSDDGTNNTNGPISVPYVEGQTISYTLHGTESACNTPDTAIKAVVGISKVGPVSINSGPSKVCENSANSTFSRTDASNATGYSWWITPGAGTITPSGASDQNKTAVVNWDNNFVGTATIRVTAGGDCSSSTNDPVTVQVVANPDSQGFNVGTTSLCAGSLTSATLSNSQSGYQYRLIRNGAEVPNSRQTGSNGAARTWSNLDLGTYYVQGRYNSAGLSCGWANVSSSKTVNRRNPGNIAFAQSGTITGCVGDVITLLPTGGSGYSVKIVGTTTTIAADENGNFPVAISSGPAVQYELSGTEPNCNTIDKDYITLESTEPYGEVVFTGGDNAICQGDQNKTYSIANIPRATISWSLEPISAGTISNGVVDWSPSYNGTSAKVRATATGTCGWSKSNTYDVSIDLNVVTPTFTSSLDERNMGTGTTTYAATAIGADNYAYSLSPPEAGNMNSATGVVSWSAAYYGPSTIAVTASGPCGSSKTNTTTTLIKNPNVLTLAEPVTNQVVITGETLKIKWPALGSDWLYDIYYRKDGALIEVDSDVMGDTEGTDLIFNWNDVPALGMVDIIVRETRSLVSFEAQDVELVDHINVTAPLAQSYGKESETNINWTGGSSQSPFQVELYANGTKTRDIGPGIGGTLPWTIPADLSNTYDYQIKVSQGTQEAFSATFTVMGCVELVTLNEDKNYIRSMVPRVPVSECLDGRSKEEVVQSISYVDGLGRPMQQIAVAASPNGLDWVSGTEFDDYGRALKQYLPYAATYSETTLGSYRSDWKTQQVSYLDERFNGSIDQNYGFSEQIPENSPLNRPLKTAAPGQVWSTDDGTHLIENTYLINDANEIPDVHVNDLGEVVFAQGIYYAAGELSGMKVTDENNGDQEGESITWTNRAGQTVLKAVKIMDNNAVNYMKTLYGYDEFGNLRFVVQPQGIKLIEDGVYAWSDLSSPGFREKWMFTYEYDHWHRMISKSVPGADPVQMIYDDRDRLVMTRDGNQNLDEFRTSDVTLNGSTNPLEENYEVFGAKIKLEQTFHVSATAGVRFHAKANPAIENGGWTFTKYDELNRPVMTGQIDRLADYNTLVGDVQTFHEGGGSFGESYTGAGPLFGYTNTAYPFESNEGQTITEDDLLTVTFYDDYAFTNEPLPGNAIPKLTGQVTGSKTRVLGTDTWLTTITFYDERYRVLKTIAENHLGGRDVVDFEYLNSISELVIKTTTTHTGGETVTIVEEHTYDHMDRLMTITHTIDGGEPELIVSNTYNKMGEMIEKNLGGSPDEEGFVTPVQSVDYNYNIRGWLTTINNGSSLDAGEEDQFGMQLKYSDAATDFKQYNGNIGHIHWITKGGNGQQTTSEQQFDYTYDAASRILSADYIGGNNDLSSIGYDFNGNIQNLSRNAKDVLTYTYGAATAMSNQLLSVTDAGGTTLFKDGNTDGDDYAYDDNGNMTKDLNKEISNITYNHLNLPEVVNTKDGAGNSVTITYTYDATGIKLRKTVVNGSNNTTTDYVAGMHFIDNALSFLQHGSGRVVKNASTFNYEYSLIDHLGNVRVSVSQGTNGPVVEQRDDYYPFGLTFNHWQKDPPENFYKFQGQEHQPETGWDQYKWRNADPTIGRFFNVDPLSDKFYYNSPYAFSENKVVVHVELEGLESFYINGGGNDLFNNGYGSDFGSRLNVHNFIQVDAHAGRALGFAGLGGMAQDADIAINSDFARKPVSTNSTGYQYAHSAFVSILNQVDDDPSTNLNLIGYSYGSTVVAQAALMYLDYQEGSIIDNVVLIGSTIDQNSELFEALQEHVNSGRIGDIHYVYTEGDEVLGAASKSEEERSSIWNIVGFGAVIGDLLNLTDTKHIYFGDNSEKGKKTRQKTADELNECISECEN